MPRKMVMNTLSCLHLIAGQGGLQNIGVMLDILGDKVELTVCHHQLLAELCIDTCMHFLERFRPAGINQGLVKFALCIKPD